MKTETKKSNRKTKYTTDYDFWLKHKDEYIYVETNKNKSYTEND